MDKLSNLKSIFTCNVKISNLDILDEDAIIPHNVELVVSRVPIRKKDGFSIEKIKKIAAILKNKMVNNGIVFLICYGPNEDKARPFEVANAMTDAGFNHVDTIIAKKDWIGGKRSEVNLVNAYEYIFFFVNGKVFHLDRQPVREYMGIEDETKCIGNLWEIKVGSLDDGIPQDLVELLIKTSDLLPGSLVMDVFGNNTSVLNSAIKLGHSFVSFETNDDMFKKYEKIIDKYSKDNKRK